MLDREEYIEQAYLFRMLGERMKENMPMQELLALLRDEVLTTSKLPLAIDFMLGELRHTGVMSTAMSKLSHYFAPFQTYVMEEAENDRGRFDIRTAVTILEREAAYRAEGATTQGIFLYQFETLCRNRLQYDAGLGAIAADPIFDENWRQWIMMVRREIGLIDVADMIYVRSEHYYQRRKKQGLSADEPERPILFGANEGRIAWANRRKGPLLLFAALQRQLAYPQVPRPKPPDEASHVLPRLARRVEQLATRIKLLEDEQQGGIDLTKFYGPPPQDDSDAPTS